MNWVRDAPFCSCNRPDPERVLYICLELNCHEPGKELYCLCCSEQRKHQGEAIRIQNSIFRMLDIAGSAKQLSDEMMHKYLKNFKAFKNIVTFLESTLVPQQVRGYKTVSEDALIFEKTSKAITDLNAGMESMARDKRVQEFLSNFQQIDQLSTQLKSLDYLTEMSEDFLFTNYFTHFSQVSSMGSLSTDEKITILNLKIRYTN